MPVTEVIQVDPKFNPDFVMGPGDDVPRLATKVEREEFGLKDSGERREFASGMVRDTSAGKINFLLVRYGPMLKRWATHLTKGETKYPSVAPGVPNWTLAAGPEELERFMQSFCRHAEQWLNGDRDEDHAAALFFNINGAETLLERGVSLGSDARHAYAATPSSFASLTGESAPSTTLSGWIGCDNPACQMACRCLEKSRLQPCCLIRVRPGGEA